MLIGNHNARLRFYLSPLRRDCRSFTNFSSAIFQISSILTPLFQGMIAGGIVVGRYHRNSTVFLERFVMPWQICFSLSVGVLLCSLNAFLAACYLFGETQDTLLQRHFSTMARYAAGCV